jgi:hypothetical protein
LSKAIDTVSTADTGVNPLIIKMGKTQNFLANIGIMCNTSSRSIFRPQPKERNMFGQKNPKAVAKKQLVQAELDLLEVSSTLESYQSNKKTLEDRIVRLKAYLGEDDMASAERTIARNTADIRGLNHTDYEVNGSRSRTANA